MRRHSFQKIAATVLSYFESLENARSQQQTFSNENSLLYDFYVSSYSSKEQSSFWKLLRYSVPILMTIIVVLCHGRIEIISYYGLFLKMSPLLIRFQTCEKIINPVIFLNLFFRFRVETLKQIAEARLWRVALIQMKASLCSFNGGRAICECSIKLHTMTNKLEPGKLC